MNLRNEISKTVAKLVWAIILIGFIVKALMAFCENN